MAVQKNAVLISEDDWLLSHYLDQINSFEGYLKFSAIIKPFVKSHVQKILQTGTSVVMDFPANTVGQRAWFKGLCVEINCAHELVYLDASNEQCLTQIAKRRDEQPERVQFDTEAVFNQVTQYFEPPLDSEGLTIMHPDKTV